MVNIKRMKLNRKGIESFLSPLEVDVLNILWKKKSSRVRTIYQQLRKKRRIALTSVAVILDRLYKKGLVSRKIGLGKGGAYYIYTVKFSRPELAKSILNNVVDKLIESFGSLAVTYFHERFAKRKKK
ncbi:MAG: BlaI/MecI/CopY family transcriptional regulator [Candidatus Aenigmatarchaeota archaeon]